MTYRNDHRTHGIAPATQQFSITSSFLPQTQLLTRSTIFTPPFVSATASSGLVVTFRSLTPASCQLTGSTRGSQIYFQVDAGTCSIRASQGGSDAIPQQLMPTAHSHSIQRRRSGSHRPPTTRTSRSGEHCADRRYYRHRLFELAQPRRFLQRPAWSERRLLPYRYWSNVGVGTYTLEAKADQFPGSHRYRSRS